MNPINHARRTSPAAIAVWLCVAVACDVQSGESNEVQWTPSSAPVRRGVDVEAIRAAIDSVLAGTPIDPIDRDTWQHVRGLYARDSGGPFWMTSTDVDRRRARELGDVLVGSVDDALNPAELPLASAIEALERTRAREAPTARDIARSDVLLTAVYVRLAEQLMVGHVDPRSVSQSWYIDPREEHVDTVLSRTLRAPRLDQAMSALRPHHDAYESLRVELERYRRLVAAGGWTDLTMKGLPLSPGDSAPAHQLDALRERLRVEGLVDGRGAAVGEDTTEVGSYDSALAGAIARFQARHGIVVDSALGVETLASLNVPAGYRLAQVAANLERLRWMPRALGERYILVNVPAFRLQAFDNGVEVLTMKVIVGAEYDGRSTPVFADSMESVVFRPYWNVPETIAENEIWPKAEEDQTFLARNNYEVVDGDEGPRVRQQPGPGNALGLVKFLFPNSFAIYLHDTPQGDLFEEDVRAFSHGCIRVEKPDELAQYVLGWSADSVRRLMEDDRDDRHVKVSPKIPVYIVYLTSYVRDGELYFGNDLYSRDTALVAAVRTAAVPDEQTLAQLEQLRRVASGWRLRWPFGN
jgi:murein L,D-transpeptidase YcbB/YkuD